MAQERNQIVFIGEFKVPAGDAAAIRTMSLARICRDLGYRVCVIGKGRLSQDDFDAARQSHFIEDIEYVTMNPAPVSAAERLRHPVRRLTLYRRALQARDPQTLRTVVINACDSALHVPSVKAFCDEHRIPLIADVCEWYDPSHRRYGRLTPSYLVFATVFHLVLPRIRNLIVVSKLLERHFAGAGRHMIRIAAPIDVGRVPHTRETASRPLILLYAGMPGRKDLLREVFAGLAMLSAQERAVIQFRLLGPTRAELESLLGESSSLLDELGPTVVALGRVPHSEVLRELQSAHFTVLIRPDERYAHAGFPSKIAESLAAGVPALLNFTSDLGDYLRDSNAVIEVRSPAPADVADALRKALALTPAELASAREAARGKATQLFDYRTYSDTFAEYLGKLA
jgi:glycosyltransferase involved in cell wall biosynthesis